jgi:hypothetical protein
MRLSRKRANIRRRGLVEPATRRLATSRTSASDARDTSPHRSSLKVMLIKIFWCKMCLVVLLISQQFPAVFRYELQKVPFALSQMPTLRFQNKFRRVRHETIPKDRKGYDSVASEKRSTGEILPHDCL